MSSDVLALLIPLAAVTLALVGGIVKTLTRHQREMARLLAEHQRALAEIEARTRAGVAPLDASAASELAGLRARLASLEERVEEPEAAHQSNRTG